MIRLSSTIIVILILKLINRSVPFLAVEHVGFIIGYGPSFFLEKYFCRKKLIN